MSKVEYISDDLALVGNGEVIVDIGETLNLGEIKQQPKSPKIKESGSSELANWGDDNDFPQQVISVCENSTELPSLLDHESRMIQGREVVAMRRVLQYNKDNPEKSKWVFVPIEDQEISDFLTDTTFKRYWRESAGDLVWFANVFPELIKSKKGDKIAYIGTQDASFCRWSKQDKKGNIKKCFVSANWPAAKIEDPETIKYPVVDPYSTERIEEVRKSTDQSFIYPCSYPSPGKVYYQLSKWHGFITSGWAEIARSIPRMKKSIMNRLLSVKYILRIPLSYWPAVYKDWYKKSAEEQLTIKKAKVKSINDQLTGSDNAGKTILNEFGKDHDGRDVPVWEIIPIESAFKDGEHLEDSREASEHLMRSIGTDPTLVGDGPGKKMGGGSGSDKRIAFNIKVALLQPYRDVLLEPLYFIAEYNGWKKKYPGLTFKVMEVELQTLDEGNTAKQVTN